VFVFPCSGIYNVSRVQFEIEQDEDANMFVASWDDPAGGGITTQARSLPELYSAIQESVHLHFARPTPREVAIHFKNDPTLQLA